MAGQRKAKKRNFTEVEVETLVGEVEARKEILFGGHGIGITNIKKQNEWQHVAAAVNAVSESAVGGEEDDDAGEGPSAAGHPAAPTPSTKRQSAGRVLTDAVLQLQRETIAAVNLTEEMRQIRNVITEIATDPGACLNAPRLANGGIYLYASPFFPTPIYPSPCRTTPIYLCAFPC
ncbi:unnamed protein product [Boreogadus saida]